MKLKILLEQPDEDYNRKLIPYEFDVFTFEVKDGVITLYKEERIPWRVFNVADLVEIAVGDEDLLLYSGQKKPSGPATTGTVVPIKRKD